VLDTEVGVASQVRRHATAIESVGGLFDERIG
jgi:hypothetical protein